MLLILRSVFLNGVLVALLAWAIARDYCLIHNAPQSDTVSYGVTFFGLVTQCIALGLFSVLVNAPNHYFDFLRTWTRSRTLRATLLALPLVMMVFADDMIAWGIYNAGALNKLETARRTDAAKACCSVAELLRRL